MGPEAQRRERPDRHVLLRYAALHAPGELFVLALSLAAWQWLSLPSWAAWAVPLGWAAKDAVLFPFVWRAYEPDDPRAATWLIGQVAVSEERLDPGGWARLGAELWRVELADATRSVQRGAKLRVVGVEGLVLRVEPLG